MGKTIGHAVLWPAPPAVPYRAGSPSHSSQPGSEKSLVVTVVAAEKNSCSQARSRASKHSAQLRRGKNSSQLTEDLAQGHSQDSTWPGTGPPPARITLRKEGGGAPGRGQELPAPAWARQHTGRNVPSSAGPPSACRLPHPGMAECNPGAAGGCSAEAAVQPPSQTTNPPFPFVHKRVPRKPGCVQAWRSAFTSVTQGTNHPRPEGVAHHALSGPSSLPRLTKCLDAHSSEAPGRRTKGETYIICKHAPLPPGLCRHPGQPTRTDSHPPPPAPQHLSPGMPWEVQRAGLCRRCCWIKRKMLS